MRLIDADEIIKQFDPNTWQGEMMIAIAKGLPTAYDVDKVVEQMEKKARGEWGYPSVMEYDDVISIVKGGGVDE